MSATRARKDSPVQATVRQLHACVLACVDSWRSANNKLAAHAQAVVNAHLQLGFPHSASMGAVLNEFRALQVRLEARCHDAFQRRLDEMTASLRELVDGVVGALVDGVDAFCAAEPTLPDTPVFKTCTPRRFGEMATQLCSMYIKELQVKQAVLTAFGGDNVLRSAQWYSAHMAALPLRDDVAALALGGDAPAVRSAAAEPDIRAASSVNAAALGRLGLATEDTLTLYLDAIMLDPFVDTDNVGVVLDAFAFELT